MVQQPFQDKVRKILEGVLGVPFSEGNQIDVLKNGDEIFPAMIEAIEQATVRIDFLTFVYWKGDIARKFAKAMAAKAREGVAVRVLLDGFGARPMSMDLLEMMEEAGVIVAWFRPLPNWKFWKVNHRTHRKVLVVDSKIGFTGGVGIAEEWEGNAEKVSDWRDTHFRVKGPAVSGLLGAFFGNWVEEGQLIHEHIDNVSVPSPVGDTPVQVIRATASIGWSDIATLLQLLIYLAEHEVQIATAYFVPDEQLVNLLCEKARSGIQIKIMMPGPHTDERVSQLAGESTFQPLLDAGVQLYSYQKTMLHTKIMIIDRQITCVGSANFNHRSMRKDDEVCMVMMDQIISNKLGKDFVDDMQHAERLTAARWRKRGLWQKTKEKLAQPVKDDV